MNSEENVESFLISESCIVIDHSSIVTNFKPIYYLNTKDLFNRKRLKNYYEVKNVDAFFKLLQKNEHILFGRESKDDINLFEEVLRTNNHDHAEFIRKIWIKFELWKNKNMLTTYNSYMKLPIDYINESGSSLNLICFLVYDFNTRKKVKSKDGKKYFLNLKSKQYLLHTGKTIFKKLYSIIEDEKMYQEICIQLIEEILIAKLYFILDIEIETSIEYVLKMQNLHYSTEILKLLVFYWDINENPLQFKKYQKILAQKSPFCELMLNFKEGTKHNFQELQFKNIFYCYLDEMKLQFKGRPNLHKMILQKDRKYLMNHKIFPIKYRSYLNKYYIINEITNDPMHLDLHDDFIFMILSEQQKIIQHQIMNSSNTNKLDELLKTTNYQEILLILLARSQDKPENILEQMLRKPDNIVNDLLQKLCSEYEMESFYTKEMLQMRNPLGKQLMDYVIESEDDKNMFQFLMSNFADKFADNFEQSLLVLKNEQLKEKTDKTIFQKIYEIISNNADMKADCMLILESLLHEMIETDDIEFDCDIQTVLAMEPIYRDEILRLLVIYWKIDSFNYEKYKNHPVLNEKIYDLMIMLKNQNDENFKETFSLYLLEIMEKENYQSYVLNDANILLALALRYGQKRAMETIVACQTIEVSKIRITTDKSVLSYEDVNFLMKLMLKYGYNVHDLNHSWVNVDVFEDNLDDRIIEDQHNIIIDYKSFNNDKGSYINQDDSGSLFSCYNILNNRCLKNNMTHPVLSTFINLKALKYHRFNVFNYWIFIAIHMLPFYVLLSYPNHLNKLWLWLIYFICILGTGFLIMREFIQFIISDTAKYFKKPSNYIEIVLIVLSVLVLMLIPQGTGSNIMTYSSALLVLLATVDVLTFLPYPSMAIYMFMFKNVAITFWKFLLIFFLIIFAFAFSFCIVMKPVAVNNELSNSTVELSMLETIIDKSLKKFDDDGLITNNFENLHTSLLKTLQMMSGEFTIEPFDLDNFQKLLFCCFVITSLILFNLIIGLVISDIQDVKEQADFLFLQNQVENTLHTSEAITKFKNHTGCYWCKKIIEPIALAMLGRLIDDYMFLDDIEYLCVNKSNKEVFVMHNKQKLSILKTKSTSSCKVYKLENETVERFIDIVTKNKSNKNQVKEELQLEIKASIEILQKSMDKIVKAQSNSL